MKKRIGLIFAAAMLFIVLFTVNGLAYYDTENTAYEKPVDFLEALGILEGRDDGFFAVEEAVTRAEVCDILLKMRNITPARTENLKFDDISKNYWAYDSIAYLSSIGVISGDGRNFYPENNITYNELLAVIVRFLGYSVYAEQSGGYPDGYVSFAASAKLLKNISGISYSSVVTRGDLAIICFNTMEAPVNEIKGQTNGYIDFESGRTVMELYWDMYEVSGIINGVYGISEENWLLSKNQVLIDGVLYKVEDTSIDTKLGYYIHAYYQKDNNDEMTILYADFKKNNTSYIISADDIINISDYKLTFAENDMWEKTVKLSRSIDVVLNGIFQPSWDDFDIFDIDSGTIELIDNDGDGIMDYAVIEKIMVFIVKKVDVDKGIVYDYYDRKAVLDIKTGAPFVRIRSTEGTELTIEKIECYDVLDVVKTDGEYYDIIVSKNTATGKVTEIDTSERIMKIDNIEYTVDYNFAQKTQYAQMKAGDTYTFFIDARGYICGYQDASADAPVPACLISVWYVEYEDLPVRFRVYNMVSGEIETLYGADKIEIDGYKHKKFEDIYKALIQDTEHKKTRGINQVVLYKLNSDNLIDYIDTAEKTIKESEESLRYGFDKKERVYRSAYNCFDKTFVVSDSTIFAAVFADAEANEMYMKETKSNYSTNYYVCETYRYGQFKGYENIFLHFIDQGTYYISSDSLIGIVSSVQNCINDDNEVGYSITIASKGGLVNKFMPQQDFESCGGTKCGDTIRYAERRGQIKNIEIIHSYDSNQPIIWDRVSENSSDGKSIYEYRYVYDVYDDVIAMTDRLDNPDSISYLIPSKSVTVLYDGDEDKAGVASLSDIKGYVSDENDCSRVIVQWKSNEPSVIAIYK